MYGRSAVGSRSVAFQQSPLWLGLLSLHSSAIAAGAPGLAMAFFMLLAAPFLLFLSIRFRPLYYQPAVVGITVVALAVGLPVVCGGIG